MVRIGAMKSPRFVQGMLESERRDWRRRVWGMDPIIGAGRPIDTDKYFVICANVIGSCYGSTGPTSINPRTGKPYNLSFPVLMVRDMVRAQQLLLDRLGIDRVLTVIGGSMGAMQAVEWAIHYPERTRSIIPIAGNDTSSGVNGSTQIAMNATSV